MNSNVKNIAILVLFIFIIAGSSCKKEWKNVYDENFDPVASAPSGLSAEIIDSTYIRLSWTDNSSKRQGFKIDRKKGNEEWENSYGIVTELSEYNDSSISAGYTYYYRVFAYAGNNSSNYCEAEVHYVVAPTVVSDSIGDVSYDKATCYGNVINDGGGFIIARGMCWDTIQNPSLSQSQQQSGTGIGSFTCMISNLKPNTIYYIRSYATNNIGTGYGNQLTCTTGITTPTVTTSAVSNTQGTSAVCGGIVSSDGGSTVTERGVCWSSSFDPTVSDQHTIDGSGTGTFISNLTGLIIDATYYVRAYATNSEGTSYGSTVSFISVEAPSIPVLTTSGVTNISQTTATCGGSIISDGGASIQSKGVCWGTSPNPTTSNSYTSDGTGTGNYTSSITGLSANTTYYVRAYATNSEGTAYGNEQTFSSSEVSTVPVLTTNTLSNISQTTATCGGNVTNDGGLSVTSRGVCWSTSPSPTLSNSYTVDGSGTGSFTSALTGLVASTTYYVRAYATNNIGTAYGDSKTFSTIDSYTIPLVTTSSATSISQTTAVSGGNVTSDGGVAVTARGICLSTNQNPTISDFHTTNGGGTGAFASSLSGLTYSTTYYIRAYATNSEGTGYGNQVSFTTLDPDPCDGTSQVSYNGLTYNVIGINDQCWFKESLNYSVTGSYSYGNNSSNSTVYGKLYTWDALMNGASSSSNIPSGVKGICPTGWHIPSKGEWDILLDFLGSSSSAGGFLKEVGTSHWNSPNTGATDAYGFKARGAGSYDTGFDTFTELNQKAYFATSTMWSYPTVYVYYLSYDDASFFWMGVPSTYAVSVRCLKD